MAHSTTPTYAGLHTIRFQIAKTLQVYLVSWFKSRSLSLTNSWLHQLNAAYLIPAGFREVEARSNLVALQTIWLCIEYKQRDESEEDTQKATSAKIAIRFDTHCGSIAADVLWETTHCVDCLIKSAKVLTES